MFKVKVGVDEAARDEQRSAGGFEPPREKVRRRNRMKEEAAAQRREKTTGNNTLRLLPAGIFQHHFSGFNLPVLLFLFLPSAVPKQEGLSLTLNKDIFSSRCFCT